MTRPVSSFTADERAVRDAEIIQQFRDGTPTNDLATRFKLDRSRISQILRAAGLGKPVSLRDRVMSRFLEEERGFGTPCWTWQGAVDAQGYGAIWFNNKYKKAHRMAYEIIKGPIPDGLVIDHLCRNRNCVNPAHLEPVTSAENTRRGHAGQAQKFRMASRTHCSRGHELTESNTYRPEGTSNRRCRECGRINESVYRSRLKFAHGSHHGQEPAGAGFQPIPPFDAPAGSDPFATAQHADCANRNDRADSTDLTMTPCAKTAQEELSCKR